ncbi:MAG: cytochrome c3 family protein [Nitrospirota bacterium]
MNLYIISFISAVFLIFNISVAASQESPDCAGCHITKPYMKGKVVHAAIKMGCSVCHSDAHNKESKRPKGLSAEIPKLCFNCHDSSKFTDKVIHSPVAGGMCTNCHDPHTSDIGKLLRAAVPDLCYNCHRRFSGKAVHAPVASGLCMSCHKPHAGSNPSLILKPMNGLCMDCHPEVVKKPHIISGTRRWGHPLYGRKYPNKEGERFSCISCHNPHDSDSVRLLRFKATSTFSICINCHKDSY